MKNWTISVTEPLVGFPVHAAPWTKTAKRYVAFKRRVRLLANLGGLPDEIPKGSAAVVSIAIAWKKKARIDTSNILKAIEDGLFKRDRGIKEVHATRIEQTGIERVSITVQIEN
jgi:hypothetical protein